MIISEIKSHDVGGDIRAMVIFNLKAEESPQVQVILNVFRDDSATVKFYLPRHPAEEGFYHVKEMYFAETSSGICDRIHDVVNELGGKIRYWGF